MSDIVIELIKVKAKGIVTDKFAWTRQYQYEWLYEYVADKLEILSNISIPVHGYDMTVGSADVDGVISGCLGSKLDVDNLVEWLS